jgi:hypothetical protein
VKRQVRGDDIKWYKHIESSSTRMIGPSVGMAHSVTKILLTGSVFASGWCCWWWPQSLVRWPLKTILSKMHSKALTSNLDSSS